MSENTVDDETPVRSSFDTKKYRKVLGINWEIQSDDFIFEFKHIVDTAERLETREIYLRLAQCF